MHAIRTTAGDHVEMLSDEAPGQPRFKLTYDRHGADELAIDFAMAMPGSAEFKHYTGGRRAPRRAMTAVTWRGAGAIV